MLRLNHARWGRGLGLHRSRCRPRQYICCNVYNYMAGGLARTGIVCHRREPGLVTRRYSARRLYWVLLLARWPGPVPEFSYREDDLGTAQLIFWLYSGLVGFVAQRYLLVIPSGPSRGCFFITAGPFAR